MKESGLWSVYTYTMNTRNLLIGLVVVLVVVGGIAAVWGSKKGASEMATPTPEGTQATTTAPDTTTPTPTPATSTPEKEADTAALGQRIYKFGVHMTPIEVVEDSRCPMGVYCIQAGTVRVKVLLEDGTHTDTVIMTMGSPVSFGNKHVALMSVVPQKSQTPIKQSDYRFTFSVAYGMGGDAP